MSFLFFRIYFANDENYSYKISICKQGDTDTAAVQQHGTKWKESEWKTIGTFHGAHVTGGSKSCDQNLIHA